MGISLLTMAKLKKLLVDADAFVAIVIRKDSNYQKAKLSWGKISKQNLQLMVSDPAFGEAVTVISQKESLKVAIKFAEETLSSSIEIIEVDSSLRRQALDIFKKQTSKNSRFTDCINMAIMKQKGLDTIFSFDEQYKKNKFKRFGIDK